ncbi:meiosis-specific topoisomerase Spo11 [Didymella exigua CBS 183.55]|uniref:DNA topoisomerase (ATP-hydrolyzing) n=1 Tax=Didymella exigua CBS 183.55 TaxID=1150837 RepID=A0A6A5RRX1_9PLEO|nr:meiosis-specific topoisomerase Spo11 [Didymella exigua CBS 183.55]KAF1928237.1 meiosis-specific topoisomerase Spo11 [Didymella exigua CBS 183.55]
MDLEDVQDLLFGAPDSQEDFEDLWNDEYDDEEMLDIADNLQTLDDDDLFDTPGSPTADSWQLLSSPPLTPADALVTLQRDAVMTPVDCRAQSVDLDKQRPRDRHWVIARLEAMLEKIVDGLLGGNERLTFTLKSRANISRRQPVAKHKAGSTPAPKVRQISFPGSTAQEAWNFTVLLRIIELVHGGLVDNTIMTKRDIYYKHPDLFVKQAVVDRYVDDLACTLNISRYQLNVTAAAKGLVAGYFTLHREDGTQVDGLSEKEGMLIPKIGETDRLDLTQLRWILVIEKEATFRALISTTHWEDLALNGLAVTAKGYPDVASRIFLRQLTDHAPHVPMYAFVDLDPDGIAIMTTYKYGSYRLAHEDVAHKDAPALSLPNLRWLGVKRHHISQAQVNEGGTDTSATLELQGLMRLTARDRMKAICMLEWDLCTEDGSEQEWRHELQTMLVLNTKAEIQILDELPGGVVSFLSSELDQDQATDAELVVDTAGSDDGLLF